MFPGYFLGQVRASPGQLFKKIYPAKTLNLRAFSITRELLPPISKLEKNRKKGIKGIYIKSQKSQNLKELSEKTSLATLAIIMAYFFC